MSRHALIVYNPISGKDPLGRPELEACFKERFEDFTFDIFETSGEDDSKRIQQMAQKSCPDLILIGGGDGTVKLVARAVRKEGIPFCILPLGSANGLARCLGIHDVEDTWEAIESFLVKPVDAIEINGETCLHLADFGFNANLVKKFEEEDKRGMISYLKNSISEIFTTDTTSYKLTLDDQVMDVYAKMVVLANGNQYGTGATINSKGRLDDGLFEIIALNPQSLDDFVKITLAMFRGDLETLDCVQHWQGENCQITSHHKVEFQIDGEPLGVVQNVNAKIHKHAFQFLVGKNVLPESFSN